MQDKRLSVDPTSYKPLLQLIGHAESKGNYNAYFGNAGNKSVRFTDMTIGQVLNWQANYVRQGSPSSAVGKYQIIDSTLAGVVSQQGIDHSQKFDTDMQDRLAIALIERRGAVDYVNNQLPREQFAYNLSQEWAGLPKVIGSNPQESYYASDGLNESQVGVDKVLRAIEPIKPAD